MPWSSEGPCNCQFLKRLQGIANMSCLCFTLFGARCGDEPAETLRKQDCQSPSPLHPIGCSCRSSQAARACRQASQPLSTPRTADLRRGSLGKRRASMDLELDRLLNAEVS